MSTTAALRPALHVFLSILFATTIGTLVSLAFAGDWNADWRFLLVLAGIFGGGWYIITFLSTFFDLLRSARAQRERNPSFPATSFVTMLYSLLVVFACTISAGFHAQGESIGMQLIPLTFVGLAIWCWPRTIHCDEASIRQRNQWLRTIEIPYQQVDSISVDYEGTTTVLGPQGSIHHTAYHGDVDQFQFLVSKRSGKRVH